MDEKQTVDYEAPKLVDYGELAELTAGALHGDPLNAAVHPEHDPHLTFSG